METIEPRENEPGKSAGNGDAWFSVYLQFSVRLVSDFKAIVKSARRESSP